MRGIVPQPGLSLRAHATGAGGLSEGVSRTGPVNVRGSQMAERTDRAVGEIVTGAGGGGSLRDGLSPGEVERLLAAHQSTVRPRLDLMWRYYRNPLTLTNAQGSAKAICNGRLTRLGTSPEKISQR